MVMFEAYEHFYLDGGCLFNFVLALFPSIHIICIICPKQKKKVMLQRQPIFLSSLYHLYFPLTDCFYLPDSVNIFISLFHSPFYTSWWDCLPKTLCFSVISMQWKKYNHFTPILKNVSAPVFTILTYYHLFIVLLKIMSVLEILH